MSIAPLITALKNIVNVNNQWIILKTQKKIKVRYYSRKIKLINGSAYPEDMSDSGMQPGLTSGDPGTISISGLNDIG